MSKAYHMSKIFNPQSGNTLLLPVDHGILGEPKGLEDPVEVLRRLLPLGVDGVLLNDGIRVQSEALFYGRSAPCRIASADTFYWEGNHLYHDVVTSPERALRAGCDGLKVLLVWNRKGNEQMRNVKMIADLVREAEICGLPVMIEPLNDPYSDVSAANPEANRKVLTDGARIACELGADILKVAYPGSAEVTEDWVKKFRVPMIMLGGGLSGGVDELIATVDTALSKGMRGVAIGRNVWQRPVEESKEVMRRFVDIVHRKP